MQVLSCPNPKSCQNPTRQQQLHALQVAVIDMFSKQQHLQTLAGEFSAELPSQHRALTEHVASSSFSTQSSHHLTSQQSSSVNHISMMLTRILETARSLVADIEMSVPTSSSPSTPLAPLAPPQPPNMYLHPWANKSANAMLVDLFVASVELHLTAYSSAQCADGYKGQLCSQCISGYGSTGVATCRRCSSRSTNTVYYILAKLLTVILLALTMNSAISDADALQLEHEEGTMRADADTADALDVSAHRACTLNQNPQGSSTDNHLSSTQQYTVHPLIGSLSLEADHCLAVSHGPVDEHEHMHVAATASSTSALNNEDGRQACVTSPNPWPSVFLAADETPQTMKQAEEDTACDCDLSLEQQFEEDTKPDQRAAIRSHFYDYRDPILIDARKSLPIILRIFISYLQVGARYTSV